MEDAQHKKTKARSPSYPSIGLKEAVEKITAIYDNDYQNAIPRIVVAAHMGYQGLNGKSLGVLAALAKYGLLEGRGNDNKVSDLAVKIIAHPSGTKERAEALKEAAAKPELFADLDGRFGNGRVSDAAIRSFLLTEKFIPTAADSVIRSYRETKEFVESESKGYNSLSDKQEDSIVSSDVGENPPNPSVSPINGAVKTPAYIPPTTGRQAIFALAEGDVVINFPEDLSPESVADLADYLEIFMKKAKREAGIN